MDDIISYFDKIDETQIDDTTLKQRLIENYTTSSKIKVK